MTTRQLRLDISRQPDDRTCGPTSLQAVYRFFGDEITLEEVIRGVSALREGGTVAVSLACHALARGYRARLFTYNLRIFDPTWFNFPRSSLIARLRQQARHKTDAKMLAVSDAYVEFLELGGELRFAELSPRLLRRLLDEDLPVLAGLSATWLYRGAREIAAEDLADDLRGEPVGHFVVLCGYDQRARRVLIADPLHPNPLADRDTYAVDVDRVITAVLLGVLTYDANLLQLEPGPRRGVLREAR